VRAEISPGAGPIARDPVLRTLAASAAISSVSGALFATQYTLFAVK
jgi:hypothetical protein